MWLVTGTLTLSALSNTIMGVPIRASKESLLITSCATAMILLKEDIDSTYQVLTEAMIQDNASTEPGRHQFTYNIERCFFLSLS